MTRETGGLEAQLARNSAAASSAQDFLTFVTERKRREEAMMCSRFLTNVGQHEFSYYSTSSQSLTPLIKTDAD
ncbi:hypothetical protein [Cedecea lapagei]|uniref:hypothetical protein n=1 Tax=Cedecea lapagei TaxID=158823 RepID=UPI001E4124B8|nr:hypothetical protein [Cedecea lapagei]